MRHVPLCLVVVAIASPACATLVVEATESTPGTFAIEVTTDDVFDTIEIRVDGDVANGLNIVPVSGVTGGRHYVSFAPTFTLLSPLGSPSTDGVFEPGLNADIDLTYGVTTPVGGEWTAGLTDASFLQFDLLSGVADVTVNLLSGGPVVASTMIQAGAAAVPEASAVVCWSILTAGVALVGHRRRAKHEMSSVGESTAHNGNG